MTIEEMFPSNYVAAVDLRGQEVPVVIESVTMKKIGEDSESKVKPVIKFVGMKKAMVCNKTNAKTISDLHGNNTDLWVGKSIILKTAIAQYKGEDKLSLRVKSKLELMLLQPQQTVIQQPAPQVVGQAATVVSGTVVF